MFKIIRRLAFRKIPMLRSTWYVFRFFRVNRYWPDFKNPKTYNEKINYRKNCPKNSLFSVCSDKVAAKDWVAERIGSQYVIPSYFVGDYIESENLKKIIFEKGDCLVKANHNSGPVYLLTKDSSDIEIHSACNDVNRQLTVDYGNLKKEPWYSKIKPRVIVEKRLNPEEGDCDIKDYKFHIFRQKSGGVKVVLHVDFDRNLNHNRSYFDESLNWLPFSSVKYPSIRTVIERPKNYDKMLELAKKLSEPFSYVRVDLYNVSGDIYFGEMTFAPGGGSTPYSMQAYDLWMGNLWQCDPSY